MMMSTWGKIWQLCRFFVWALFFVLLGAALFGGGRVEASGMYAPSAGGGGGTADTIARNAAEAAQTAANTASTTAYRFKIRKN